MIDYKHIEFDSTEYYAALALRNSILREPLGLEISGQDTKNDYVQFHFAAIDGENVIASLCLERVNPELMKLRQMAVSDNYQGQGIGKDLIQFAEAKAKALGVTILTLDARENAIGFYSKLGYEPKGDRFELVNLPHIKMIKNL